MIRGRPNTSDRHMSRTYVFSQPMVPPVRRKALQEPRIIFSSPPPTSPYGRGTIFPHSKSLPNKILPHSQTLHVRGKPGAGSPNLDAEYSDWLWFSRYSGKNDFWAFFHSKNHNSSPGQVRIESNYAKCCHVMRLCLLKF